MFGTNFFRHSSVRPISFRLRFMDVEVEGSVVVCFALVLLSHIDLPGRNSSS